MKLRFNADSHEVVVHGMAKFLLAAEIPLDADFPQLLAQGGAFSTDIMLVPSNDWQQIESLA